LSYGRRKEFTQGARPARCTSATGPQCGPRLCHAAQSAMHSDCAVYAALRPAAR